MIDSIKNYENISLDVYKVFIEDTRKRIDDNIERVILTNLKSERLGVLSITSIFYFCNQSKDNMLLYIPISLMIISLMPAIYLVFSYKGFGKGGHSDFFLNSYKVDNVDVKYLNYKILAEYIGYYRDIIDRSDKKASIRIKYLNCQIILALIACATYFILSQVH